MRPLSHKKKKGSMPRNFSLSIKAHDEKAVVEFPLDSVREENDNFDEFEREVGTDELAFPGPRTSNQVIVHKQYQDNVVNKTLRTTQAYRLTGHDSVTDPYEIEYDKDKGPPKMMSV